jgi:hypothetical protein
MGCLPKGSIDPERWRAATSAARPLDLVALDRQQLDHTLHMVALHLDPVVLDSTARAAGGTQTLADRSQRGGVEPQATTGVTDFPPRPLVSRLIRTTPSQAGTACAVARQVQALTGCRQPGTCARPRSSR